LFTIFSTPNQALSGELVYGMDFRELAKSIVCNVIAVALSMTVSAVNGLLPHRPDWLERVEELASHFRAVSEGKTVPENEAGPAAEETEFAPPAMQDDFQRLLTAYNHLWQFTQNLRSDGLGLDDEFCERIESEWSVTTLLTYMRNADRALQDHATEAVEAAGHVMAPPGDPR